MNCANDMCTGRRDFLRRIVAATAGAALPPRLFPGVPDPPPAAAFDENMSVFMADIHVGPGSQCADAKKTFKATVDEILALRPLPRNVIVLGDVAYRYGAGEDYDVALPILKKFTDSGVAVTIAMGNHDRRSEYAKRWPDAATKSLVPGRYVHLVETEHVGFLVLDTLQGLDGRPATDTGPQGGALSKDEKAFLERFLADREKPVVICAHHPSGDLWCCGGRLDALLRSSPCVAGYIHGHFHRWRQESEREICLPSASAWGDRGYAICRGLPDRVEIECVLKGFSIPSPSGDPLVMTSAHQGRHRAKFAFK